LTGNAVSAKLPAPRMSKATGKSRAMPLVALILAWLVPGAGHAYIGRIARGIVIFVAIAATFWAGVAMGGVMTVDYHGERWWFIAQMCSGVHGLVSWHRQQTVYDRLTEDLRVVDPDTARSSEVSYQQMLIDQKLARDKLVLVAPADTVARAYAGVAGLLNLMCIFDAVILAILGVSGEPQRQPEQEVRLPQNPP